MEEGSCLAPLDPPGLIIPLLHVPGSYWVQGLRLQRKTSGECHSFGALLVAGPGGRGSEIRHPSLSWIKYLPPGQGWSMDQLWLQPLHTRLMVN